ncbi:hypothetical protein CALCODRAFT_553162 [Calocera cornea HHB12733]|uniref:Uncharacterized protein n=1 Tax=Calocera cornea HHB12733 TaxID=1353952 RepID=A0A165J7F9_9BASI|nr:hypothetical protein CALCODRAFT_553162 [Calocera cornea HHB12733]
MSMLPSISQILNSPDVLSSIDLQQAHVPDSTTHMSWDNAGLSSGGDASASVSNTMPIAPSADASELQSTFSNREHLRNTSVASIISSTSNSASDSSEDTKVDEVELRPRPSRSRPRTPITIPSAANITEETGKLKQGSVLGEAETDSPVEERAGCRGLDAAGAENEYTPFYAGLAPEADVVLKDCFQLIPELPTTMCQRVYQKPAGNYFLAPTDMQPRSDAPLNTRHRAMSGVFRSEDDNDRQIGGVEPKRLTDMNWEEHETPDGYPYFLHKCFPAVTDDYLRIGDNLEQADKWAKLIYHDIIWRQMNSPIRGYSWPEKWQLYLRVEVGYHPHYQFYGQLCYYYLINVDKREVFWLHSFNHFSEILPDLPSNASSKLIRQHLELEFWAHMEIFSQAEPVEGAEKQLRDMLLWAEFDQTTSPTNSTCPFEKGQPKQFLEVLDQFKGQAEDSPTKNVAIARLMGTCFKSRIFNRFGDHGARIDRTQPTLYPQEGKAPAMRFFVYCCMHVFVMGGDRWYLNKIRLLTVDGYVPPQAWKDLVRMLVETSNQSTLIVAALLFGGNIGFLSINGLAWDQQIISIVATLLSLGSLFVGLQQVLHHYDLKESSALVGSQYCYAASKSWLGYRGLAVYYALPNALLVWSAIATVISLLVWCFQSIELDWVSRGFTIAILLALAWIGIAALRFSQRLFGAAQGPKEAETCWMHLPLVWMQRKFGTNHNGQGGASEALLPTGQDDGANDLEQQEEGRVSPIDPSSSTVADDGTSPAAGPGAAEPTKKRGWSPVAWTRGTLSYITCGKRGKLAKEEKQSKPSEEGEKPNEEKRSWSFFSCGTRTKPSNRGKQMEEVHDEKLQQQEEGRAWSVAGCRNGCGQESRDNRSMSE